MVASLAEMVRQSRGELPPPAPAEEAEEAAEELPSYGRLRGQRQVAFMLELRHATGDSDAFDYGLLGSARLDPSHGIVLRFAGATVTIRGKMLRPLYEAILAHRVPWAAVADAPAASRDPSATVVTAIEVDPPLR